ncbi:nickel-dependent hydrogenase large subunit [Acidocella sp.]|uniref:nickel-dependent hydrogenase large subunit n=1 Tax=Acidocella sp. TaxID=50710 RepID=UPI002604E3C4|nr:nickel-dependent hydrogenase large subunit [Acidocella sp.]
MTVQTPNGFSLDNSGRRMVVDPVTRIEGHMRCEVNLDANNVIQNAVSSGTMWRGLELILKGRDPRDAWAFCERICGVCTGTHALTSVRAVENALGIQIPENANIIRNIMQLTLYAHDHLVHFYHLHALDWVDVVSALQADPKATSALAQSISPWGKSSPGYFSDVRARLQRFVDSGQLGPFMNGYWGNPAYVLPPEGNLMAVAHYLEALDFQREIVKIHTVFGGKNPHPNWLVGGMACAINVDEPMAAGAPVNMASLNLVSGIIDRTIEFIDQVYIPDLKAIASFYKNWDYGQGLAGKNVLAYGEFPRHANDYTNLMMPRGAILNGNLNEVMDVDLTAPDQVQEYVDHSWYQYPDESKGLHPWDGITEPNFELGANTVGTKTNIQQLDEGAKYSFIKAARWKGNAMEVGPLSRFTVAYARGLDEFKQPVDQLLTDLGLPFAALFTTLGRTAARGLEAQWAAHKLKDQFNALIANIAAGDLATANTQNWEPSSWAPAAKGVGFTEAPRGALGHWVHIEAAKIASYQAVVPTTWNGSPRDPAGNIGAFEAALLGTPLANPTQPLEILRTLHSFDPCLACSTHVMAPDGGELVRVKVR